MTERLKQLENLDSVIVYVMGTTLALSISIALACSENWAGFVSMALLAFWYGYIAKRAIDDLTHYLVITTLRPTEQPTSNTPLSTCGSNEVWSAKEGDR